MAYTSSKTFRLKTSNDEMLDLGTDSESAEKTLKPDWPELVYIESSFNLKLKDDEDTVMAQLSHLKKALADGKEEAQVVSGLIDPKAVEECISQATLLLPRLRRMRNIPARRLLS